MDLKCLPLLLAIVFSSIASAQQIRTPYGAIIPPPLPSSGTGTPSQWTPIAGTWTQRGNIDLAAESLSLQSNEQIYIAIATVQAGQDRAHVWARLASKLDCEQNLDAFRASLGNQMTALVRCVTVPTTDYTKTLQNVVSGLNQLTTSFDAALKARDERIAALQRDIELLKRQAAGARK